MSYVLNDKCEKCAYKGVYMYTNSKDCKNNDKFLLSYRFEKDTNEDK